MIKGIQSMFYSSASDELSKFFQDKLGFKTIDNKNDCLILDAPEVQVVAHPSDEKRGATSGLNHISFYCDDIKETVKELKGKGVKFRGDIEDHGYGYVTFFEVPGGFYIQLYEPKA